MQKRLTTFSTLLLTLVFSSVFAYSVTLTPPPKNRGFYVGLAGGSNLLQQQLFANQSGSGQAIKYDYGWNGSASLGYRRNAWQYEFNATYMSNGIKSSGGLNINDKGTKTTYLGGNILYGFNQKGRWQPYVGGGLGLAMINLPNELSSKNKNALGFQGILGLSVKISRHSELFTEYRHLQTGSFSATPSSSSSSTSTHTRYLNNLIDGGIRFYF